jgi:hypothetical protein
MNSAEKYYALREMRMEMRTKLKEVTETWHSVSTPKGKTREEIKSWLESNVNDSYYWDDTDITGSMGMVYIENKDDYVFYRMVWEEYL